MTEITERLSTALADRYKIERHLGEGGMANVYLAEDLKHHRKVAMKVLRPELAAILGAERFLKEIEVTANLQHTHILPLFDSGEADSFLYYVMPYVEGETLRDKLNRDKQLGVEETVKIAEGVAAALDYAHRQGVIHRDIKPENILIHDGQPVVADFGIAVAVTAAGGTRLTETGLSLGTPQYMSPEQATGEREVTARSDVYSLGAVVYEMLVGEPPHTGPTVQAILAKIATEVAPPVTQARKSVPLNVAATVSKALENIPADRFERASDMASALQDTAFRHGEDTTTVGGSGSERWKTLAIGASALSVAALIVAGLSLVARSNVTTPVTRWEIVPYGEGVPRAVGAAIAIAPDGSSMVFAEVGADGRGWQLWLKRRGEAEATPLPGTDSALNVTYSPDGRHIAFAYGSEIKSRPIGDGPTVTLAQGARPGQVGLAWLDDGTIIYEGARSIIVRIPERGGAADTITSLPEIFNIVFLGELPGSHGALVALCFVGCYGNTELWVMDFRADTSRLLLDEVMRGWYEPSGHLVYVRQDGAVVAAPFDLDALELAGPGVLLFEGVAVVGATPEMVVGRDGTVIYATGSAMGAVGSTAEVVWVDRSGAAEVVDPAWKADFTGLALSPTGDRVAVVQRELDGSRHIWIKQLDQGPLYQLTFEGRSNFDPAWMPDGRSIVFASDRAGGIDIFVRPTDGRQNAEMLLDEKEDLDQWVISADGEWLIYAARTGQGRDIMAKPLGRDGEAVGIADMEGLSERAPALSPDGGWLAYISGDAGPTNPYDVWVRGFPAGERTWRVSYNVAGARPKWGHSGRELFYRSGSSNWAMVSVEVIPAPTFVRGPETVLFPFGALDITGWDVAPDDQRFIFIRDATPRHVVVVENFFEELKAKVGN